MLSDESLAVAHVGYTGTDSDRDRSLAVGIWLRRADQRLADQWVGALREDHIDLNGDPPRDFLREDRRYDLVVVHDLWGFPELSANPRHDRLVSSGPTACSPGHSRDAWESRLAGCGARFIFLFGRDFNVSFFDQGVPGYRSLSVAISSGLDILVSVSLSPGMVDSLARQPIEYREMSAARLLHLSELSQNHALDLSYTALGTAHVELVAAMSCLQDLRLTGTAVSDSDLGRIVECGGIRKLDLDETAIGSAGMRHLAALPKLECLSLNGTNIDDAGLEHIGALGRLEWLSLVDTEVSDRGLACLASAATMRHLSIVNTRATAAGVERLRSALPQCAITFIPRAA